MIANMDRVVVITKKTDTAQNNGRDNTRWRKIRSTDQRIEDKIHKKRQGRKAEASQ